MAQWCAVTFASTLGGMSINQAGVTAPHGLEHPASGLRNITHGRGLAALSPVIYRRSISSAPEKFAQISQLLGGKDETDFADTLTRFLEKIDLRTNLTAEGVKAEDIDWMTGNALQGIPCKYPESSQSIYRGGSTGDLHGSARLLEDYFSIPARCFHSLNLQYQIIYSSSSLIE